MKDLLAVLSLFLVGTWGEAPAPYPPSGWRPQGPAFELPERATQTPQYLPPVDPRTPFKPDPNDIDLSVQGLPTQEQLPIFQLSPINGQQYVGSNFNADIRNLDDSFKKIQFQNQQEINRQFARQKQLDAQTAKPRQFKTTTLPPTTESTTKLTTSTESFSLNQGEILESDTDAAPAKLQKVSVEVSKQNIQEYPAELFLSPLTQNLNQFSQIRQLQFVQPEVSQKIQSAYDGQLHFAALQSVLAQQQTQQSPVQGPGSPVIFPQNPQGPVNPIILQQNPGLIPQGQIYANPPQIQPQLVQYQPQTFQTQAPQPAISPAYGQPNSDDVEEIESQSPQAQYPQLQVQPQYPQVPLNQAIPQYLQGQVQYPLNQYQQPILLNQYQQDQFLQAQLSNQQQILQNQQQFGQRQQFEQQQYDQNIQQQYDQQFQGQQQPNLQLQGQQPSDQQYLGQFDQQFQGPYNPVVPNQFGQDSNRQKPLQSDIDEQPDNSVDEENLDENSGTATAVATAFGTRTRPRVSNQYGVPTSTAAESTPYDQSEPTTESVEAVAEANAFARNTKRKSSKLRYYEKESDLL